MIPPPILRLTLVFLCAAQIAFAAEGASPHAAKEPGAIDVSGFHDSAHHCEVEPETALVRGAHVVDRLDDQEVGEAVR